MQIISTSLQDPKSKYIYTSSQDNVRMSSIANGTLIKVTDYILFSQNYLKDDKQVERLHLSIGYYEGDNFIIATTNSPTFISEFESILSIYDGDIDQLRRDAIKIIHGKSNKGREFITCALQL